MPFNLVAMEALHSSRDLPHHALGISGVFGAKKLNAFMSREGPVRATLDRGRGSSLRIKTSLTLEKSRRCLAPGVHLNFFSTASTSNFDSGDNLAVDVSKIRVGLSGEE